MRKKFLTLTLTLTFLGILLSNRSVLFSPQIIGTAKAVGDLTVDWGSGITPGDPIFIVTDFAPGDFQTKTVQVINGSSTDRPISVKGIKKMETGNLADVLNLTISEGSAILYGPVSLTQFFNSSSTPSGIALTTVPSGTTAEYDFTVVFDTAAGNAYQGRNLVFDIKIGIAFELPAECEGITFSGEPIFGTAGNNTLRGTNRNDLIVALEGDDRINGGNGRDCLLGGPGNDRLDGSNQNDVLMGGEGNDYLDGSNGEDILLGGPGNDEIRSSNGNDQAFGGPGDDKLDGGNGNDYLDGGDDTDEIDGGLGKDTCIGETKSRCEL